MKIKILILCLFLYSCSSDDETTIITGEGVFATLSEGAIIEGELFLPEGEGVFPVMIIVPGSANEPRETSSHPLIKIINDSGYGVYVYDKRGIGGSTGSYPTETPTTVTEFLTARAEDVLGIIDLLKTHTQIDPERIGVFGSSQGAWVNSIVHSKSTDLSFIVMSSCGVASVGLSDFYNDLTDGDPNLSIDDAMLQLVNFNGPDGFDPLDIIESMSLPVLWIFGNDDRSHPVRYDAEVLENLDKSNFTTLLFSNADHDLIDVTTGQQPPDLISSVTAWLDENN
ncbi:MAG: prolyl oligopeptidase family serine peptidase [Cyclobacteriaceae bacterium]